MIFINPGFNWRT